MAPDNPREKALEDLVRAFNRKLRENGYLMSIIAIQDQTDPRINFIGNLDGAEYHDIVRSHVSDIMDSIAGWSE